MSVEATMDDTFHTLDDNGDIELILKEWEDLVASSEDELESPPTPPALKEINETVEKVSSPDHIFRRKRAKMVTLLSARTDHHVTPPAAEAQDLPLVEDDPRAPASTLGNDATETFVQEAMYPEQ